MSHKFDNVIREFVAMEWHCAYSVCEEVVEAEEGAASGGGG